MNASEYDTRARARRRDLRHRDTRRRGAGRNLVSPIIAAAAVLLLVTGTGVALAQGGFFSATASGGRDCSDPIRLVVAADPAISAPLAHVAAQFDAESPTCVVTTVEAHSSVDTTALLASGGLQGVDAWVPESSLWLSRMESTAVALGREVPPLGAASSIASSPVVLAAPASRSIEFGDSGLGWASLLTGELGAVIPDPDRSAVSAAGLVSIADSAPEGDSRAVPSAMIEFGKVIPETVTEAAEIAASAALPTLVVASERDVVAHNSSVSATPLVALYPADGTTALDFPLVRIPANTHDAADRDALVAGLTEVARASDEFMLAAGLRNHVGAGQVSASGVATTLAGAVPAADTGDQVWAIEQWLTLTRPSRMLVTIDVSGSMLERAGEGALRRIDIYQRAATHQLSRYGPHAEMGVWAFSTNRVGSQDWEELAPVASLGDDAHRAHIAQITAELPSYIRGDTGLYDTILAAVQHMSETHKPGMVNSIVLITDGKNDDRVSITLDELLHELELLADPLRPIPVILIGFGPDTDMESMQAIAAQTGGAAFAALEPADLDRVFVDAFSQRECRPNC